MRAVDAAVLLSMMQAHRSRPAPAAHLDAGDEALALQQLHKGRAVAGILVQSLLVQNLQSGRWGQGGREGDVGGAGREGWASEQGYVPARRCIMAKTAG